VWAGRARAAGRVGVREREKGQGSVLNETSWRRPERGRRGETIIVIIAQRRRGCSLSRVRVNGVIIHLRPGARPGIVIS